MSSSHPIFQEAIQIANSAHRNQTNAQSEKAKLEHRIRELELEAKQNKLMADRISTFAVHRDGRLQCPSCWIIYEIPADLTAIPNDHRDDHFRCSRCGNEFIVPAP